MVNDMYQFPEHPKNKGTVDHGLSFEDTSVEVIHPALFAEKSHDITERLRPYRPIMDMGAQIRSYRQVALEEARSREAK